MPVERDGPPRKTQEGEAKPQPLDVREFERKLSHAVDAEDFASAEDLIRALGDPPLARSERELGRLVRALERGLGAPSEDANAAFQQASLLALGRCGPEGGKALDRALRNSGLRNRHAVQATIYRALGLTGEAKRMPQLVGALSQLQPEISIAAIEGLTSSIERTELPLAEWNRAAAAVERCHAELRKRSKDPTSYPPPPEGFGDPPAWPSRERVAACLPAYEAAERAFLAALRAREERENAARDR